MLPGDGRGQEAEQQDEEDEAARCYLGLLLWPKARDNSGEGDCSAWSELVLLHEGRAGDGAQHEQQLQAPHGQGLARSHSEVAGEIF